MNISSGLKSLFERIWTKNYFIFFLSIWTVLVLISVTWNLYQDHAGTTEKARIEARTIFQHNLAYRRWNAQHGVYVEISDEIRPNPYIVSPRRDLVTADGTQLTLINPFQMTRQAYELLSKQSPLAAINRTVSLEPLNPENIADEWEKEGIQAFAKGEKEVSAITEIKGKPYLRLLKPYVTEQPCLKCHGFQGYKAGDIRGAMSIAVPMAPYNELATATRRIILLTHVLLWLMGAVTIGLLSKGMQRYQKTISENERKFRIVSEFAYDFEFWVKENKEMVFISPSCERITGYSPQEFSDNPRLMFDIVHPDDKDIYRNHLTDYRAPLKEDLEFRIITKDGQVRWFSHTCSPIFVDGEFLGRRGSNKDITYRKKLEDQIIQSQKIESLGHFASGIAHDFNNLLSAINGCAFLLQEDLQRRNDSLSEYTKQILVASKLGKNLTSNLLAFGRRQVTAPTITTLSSVIRGLSDILKTLNPEDIDLRVSLTEEELPVFADPNQIGQVVINLCTNAKDAMPKGGALELRTSLLLLDQEYEGRYAAVPPGSYMMLSVRDTGMGIEPENLDRIFEPFFTTKEKKKGTGLGLAIVHSIIMQHNGYIDVESAPGAGTTFKVFFPTVERECGEGVAADDGGFEPRNQAQQFSLRGSETILVVEDNALLRNFLETFLQHQGYTVLAAEDGEEAIARFAEHKSNIDMAILDVVLPKKNGKEVYEAIRAVKPEIKVLFISGHTDNIIDGAGIRQGGLEFLAKPLDMHTFLTKVQSMLQRDPA
ncbi:MAG: ATP-binding protein [Nitrospirota bacterium]